MTSTMRERFSRIWSGVSSEPEFPVDELPLRAELFSVAQLETHAKTLAGWHAVGKSTAHADSLLARLTGNQVALQSAYALVSRAIERGRAITPAAEWFVDNYHLIEEQIRTARRHLPKRYNLELPRLINGPSPGTPRVYELALDFIRHSHGRVDVDHLRAFIAAYQELQPLRLGELWAIPIMLRLSLIENLRRIVAGVTAGRRDREHADHWIDRMIQIASQDSEKLVLVLADMVRANPPLSNAFVAQFTTRAQAEGTSLAFPMSWLEQRLSAKGQSVDHVFQSVSHNQAADQVAIGNTIGSLRLLAAIDWRDFVEAMSVVERVLASDPAQAYSTMDFASRDCYRHVVEALSKRAGRAEQEVANLAIALAREQAGMGNAQDPHHQRTCHVGYFLVDAGTIRLERIAGVRPSAHAKSRQVGQTFRRWRYGAALLALLFAVTGLVLWLAPELGLANWQWAVAAIVVGLCASQFAVDVVHWLATLRVRPELLPRLNFSHGIPASHRTAVVVPTMLTEQREIASLLETMEVRFLANRDANLSFVLLTDFRDAMHEHLQADAELLAAAQAGVASLNQRYGSGESTPFYLFHRPRRYNSCENVWMGWERKRGKLEEFNEALRGNLANFESIVGTTDFLQSVRYVIVLDSDTQLPRDAARALVSTMAHPLNRPCYDSRAERVTAGYTILQPRVAVTMASATRSRFATMFAGEPGIDPYTRAVSDVYQDLFREGSFVGKGIYDVDSFRQALAGRLPENRILSHDLLEGAYARAGLITDVLLFEDYPSTYAADVNRRHRWMRGDWQLTSWLCRRVPAGAIPAHHAGASKPLRKRLRNPISHLSQWKLLDNLRRTLVPIAFLALFFLGWSQPQTAGLAMLVAISFLLLPKLLIALTELFRSPEELPFRAHAAMVGRSFGRQLAQSAVGLASLPYDALLGLDAIFRTGVRVWITGKKLLEWRTAADAERSVRNSFWGSYRTMWIAPAVALTASIVLYLRAQLALPLALPILLLWFLAPAVTWWLSKPLIRAIPSLTENDLRFLRGLARRTWRFFESFVAAQDHFLPPDNFQEDPPRGIAHRTSPTNIGLCLTANLAAYDFGYISLGEVISRTQQTLDSLDQLERYRGHFYNWYDTQTLKPLDPMYVSTVDSGNLAGHLLVLSTGLTESNDMPLVRPEVFRGLEDTLALLIEGCQQAGNPPDAVANAADPIRVNLQSVPTTLSGQYQLLGQLEQQGKTLSALVDTLKVSEARWWANALTTQIHCAISELQWFAPWLTQPLESKHLAVLEALGLDAVLSFRTLAQVDADAKAEFARQLDQADASALQVLKANLTLASERAAARKVELDALANRCQKFADLDYDFLYDKNRHLLAIGFNATDHVRDASFYDLLASEARLASFVAIAQGKLPQEHWFHLGRPFTMAGNRPALLSWSGSMFEYLMPLLVMPTYDDTVLDDTNRVVVARQIAFGRERGVPWGVSESGYNKTDAHLNYQYQAFGVPGLGFKRGLADNLVIAPYASAMALMVAPAPASSNLQRLHAEGQMGRYGLFEAIDYTASRLPQNKERATVRSYMAHHQGMVFLSLVYLLRDRPMQRRFLADPAFRATELLLQERVPRVPSIAPHPPEATPSSHAVGEGNALRIFSTPSTPIPEVHLLSNGHYHVAITNAGGGYSRWRDLAITRWHEDATRDSWGTFGYLRDIEDESFWSIAHQPTLRRAKHSEAIYSPGRAEFRRIDGDIATHVEISVSPEDDVELRRISLTNRGTAARTLELTSYAEVVLSQPAADSAHPAFSNLFVQTEILRAEQAILCTRRARSSSEHPPWMVHLMSVAGTSTGPASFETSRGEFVGRTRTVADPIAMYRTTLSDSSGSVLDPIVAIRNAVVLQPDETAKFQIYTGIAETREGALGLIAKYSDFHSAERLLELSFTHSQVEQRHLDAGDLDIQLYERLASHMMYTNATLRAPRTLLARNRSPQSGLWAYGISGDLPIALVKISDVARIDLVRQLVKAHAYWRAKGLAADLVIWNEDPSGYRQVLQEQIMAVIGTFNEANSLDRPGGIFVRRSEQISEEDSVLMQTVARVVITDNAGSLLEQIERKNRMEMPPQLLGERDRRISAPSLGPSAAVPKQAIEKPQRPDLTMFNGSGGFTHDGREYVITMTRHAPTPAPWSNVLANQWFGTVVTESGCAYTWCENAHSYRLTPWNNDPVSDSSGEVLYIRDEEDGQVWSPTMLPAGDDQPYTTRHGFGYSVFEHSTQDRIATELTTFVATDAPIKFLVLKIRNQSGRTRKLSLTCYFDLVLGANRSNHLAHVVTELDPRTGGLLGKNGYNGEFARRIAFLDCSEETRTVTGDRNEFLGRNRSPSRPAALERARLSGRVGAGFDPCLAMQTVIELGEGQEREIAFTFGSGLNRDDACHLVSRFRGTATAHQALSQVWEYWNRTLTTVNVTTPDLALNFLANGWLLYQVLASRMWGRSGFYQSGGAFGFRDQLQDAMSLVHCEPALLREQILRCASRQFKEGDVQHWWHPPLGRGVRTRISDDYLWLPYAVCRYVTTMGDTGVLDERVGFLEGRAVKPDEDSYYDLPGHAEESATIYDHCVRAIEHGLTFGEHGLPLMGSGDWNDGMNLVGAEGKGESVWLAFFLHDVMVRFADIARLRQDNGFADRCIAQAKTLAGNIEAHGWDGQWYRRAYFDNGEPMGSAGNDECQIDALPQSWAALTKLGDPARASQALQALDKRLVRDDIGVIQLFDPAFDKSAQNPGYVKGYVPGVRENGGQYTHAAVWAAMAFAAAGETKRAWQLFDLINPLRHGDSEAAIAKYKVEPYVAAADVYTNPQHAGRGGWTWYTGSAGWMYRLITESLLGIRREVNYLRIDPVFAPGWNDYQIHYRYHQTVYHLHVVKRGAGSAVTSVVCDGQSMADLRVPLNDDKAEHHVEIAVGG